MGDPRMGLTGTWTEIIEFGEVIEIYDEFYTGSGSLKAVRLAPKNSA